MTEQSKYEYEYELHLSRIVAENSLLFVALKNIDAKAIFEALQLQLETIIAIHKATALHPDSENFENWNIKLRIFADAITPLWVALQKGLEAAEAQPIDDTTPSNITLQRHNGNKKQTR